MNPARVDRHHDRLPAKVRSKLADQFPGLDGRRVDRDLVGAGGKKPSGIVERPHPAAHCEWDKQSSPDLMHRIHQSGPPLARGRNIQQDEFVRPFLVVSLGQFAGVAGVPQVHKADAFHHAPVFAVETWDDAFGEHFGSIVSRSHSREHRRGAPLL